MNCLTRKLVTILSVLMFLHIGVLNIVAIELEWEFPIVGVQPALAASSCSEGACCEYDSNSKNWTCTPGCYKINYTTDYPCHAGCVACD